MHKLTVQQNQSLSGAGPSGGTTLNGTAMKAEAKEAQEKLIEQLKAYVDYSQPLTWVQG